MGDFSNVTKLASFDLDKIEHRWISSIKMNELSVPSRNRFALGIAGYRLLAAAAISRTKLITGVP